MPAILILVAIHAFAAVYLLTIIDVNVAIVSAIFISFLYTAAPFLFWNRARHVKYSLYQASNERSKPRIRTLTFAIIVLAPVMALTIDRMSSGFTLSINPVDMRDQMLARQIAEGGGGILALVGNVLQIPALFFLIRNVFFERQDVYRKLIIAIYFLFFIWLAGSRAYLLLLLLYGWGISGFKRPNKIALLSILVAVSFFMAITILRADRSDIEEFQYFSNVINQLRLTPSTNGWRVIESEFGVLAVGIAYILHSIPVLAGIVFDNSNNSGFALAPLVYIAGKVSPGALGFYQYEGLFSTSAGIVLHDFGWIGLTIVTAIRMMLMQICTGMKSSYTARAIILTIAVDSIMGIWTSIANILLGIPLLIALFTATIYKDWNENRLH